MLPLGGFDAEVAMFVDSELLAVLDAKRGPGETYTDVIMRAIAENDEHQ